MYEEKRTHDIYLVRNTSIKQYVTLLLVLFLSLILFLYICFFSFSHHI